MKVFIKFALNSLYYKNGTKQENFEDVQEFHYNYAESNRLAGEVCLLDEEKTVIYADWEQWEHDNNYDVVSISIYQAGTNKFNYQVEETKIKAV